MSAGGECIGSEHVPLDPPASAPVIPTVIKSQTSYKLTKPKHKRSVSKAESSSKHASEDASDGRAPFPKLSSSISAKVERIQKKRPGTRASQSKSRIRAIILDQLSEEASILEVDPNLQIKWERVLNYIQIPYQIENIMTFGMLACLDSLLHTLTIVPLQLVIFLATLVAKAVNKAVRILGRTKGSNNSNSSSSSSSRSTSKGSHSYRLKSVQVYTAIKGILMVITCILLSSVDTAKLYHSIRAQNTIKLAFIFGALDVTDRLCASLGLDIIHSMHLTVISTFYTKTQTVGPGRKRKHVAKWNRFFGHFVLALGYMLVHTMIMHYQLITWNVAVNSYGQQLLTLLISNQFTEIKSTVFKRWEKENLFQLTCADIVERFHLLIFLIIISGHNSLELLSNSSSTISTMFNHNSSGSHPASDPVSMMTPTSPTPSSILSAASTPTLLTSSATFPTMPHDSATVQQPASFGKTIPSAFSVLSSPFSTPMLGHLVAPVLIIYGSELIIDWLKHAFITKLNWIRPQIYTHYRDLLCQELVKRQFLEGQSTSTTTSQADGDAENVDDEEQDRHYSKPRSTKHSLKVSRRMGFTSLPLACVIIRVIIQSIGPGLSLIVGTNLTYNVKSWILQLASYRLIPFGSHYLIKLTDFVDDISGILLLVVICFVLLVFKLFLGANLVRYAEKHSHMKKNPTTPSSSSIKANIVSNDNTKDNASDENKRFYTDYKHLEALDRKHIKTQSTDWKDVEWETRRPKWSLDTVERYELYKSRIP